MTEEGAESGRSPARELEERVAELESLSERLGRAPDGELSQMLERAVTLVDEINAGIEERLSAARTESEGAEGLLDRVDFGPFDAALQSLERESPDEGSEAPNRSERS